MQRGRARAGPLPPVRADPVLEIDPVGQGDGVGPCAARQCPGGLPEVGHKHSLQLDPAAGGVDQFTIPLTGRMAAVDHADRALWSLRWSGVSFRAVNEPEHIEGEYRVKDEGPSMPWRGGERIFPQGALGNLLVFLLIFGAGPFIFRAIYHWFASAM